MRDTGIDVVLSDLHRASRLHVSNHARQSSFLRKSIRALLERFNRVSWYRESSCARSCGDGQGVPV
jgi:hypothetical protein